MKTLYIVAILGLIAGGLAGCAADAGSYRESYRHRDSSGRGDGSHQSWQDRTFKAPGGGGH